MECEQLLKTPLNAEHLKLNAKMIGFGGWDMPVMYTSIIDEYNHTRNSVSIFDTCHMGEFLLEGYSSISGLDYLITQNIIDMENLTCRYGAMLNENGGVIDDLIVFKVDQNKWFIVVNASTRVNDFNHISKSLKHEDSFKDLSDQLGKIDVQGPFSRDVLKNIIPGIEKLEYYCFDYFNYLGEKVLVSRTGYTGELGYEIYLSNEKTVVLWQKLLEDNRVKPAGLGARDLLRLEKGYSLYGHELKEDVSVLECGLSKFIDFEKDFFGKDALLYQKESGIKRKLIGILSENRKAPREGYSIIVNNEEVGIVTSGGFSPAFLRGIGLGFIAVDKIPEDGKLSIGSLSSSFSAGICSRIFLKGGSLKD